MLLTTSVTIGDKSKGGGSTIGSHRLNSGDPLLQLLELAGSECREDREAFYRQTAPLFQALCWYQRLCAKGSNVSPSLVLEAIGIAVRLTEDCLALLQRINSEAYELFLEIQEGNFPFHMDEEILAN